MRFQRLRAARVVVMLAAAVLAGLLGASSVTALPGDADSDGVLDENDNCPTVPNGPLLAIGSCDSQQDADMDGYGNPCDADFNENGYVDSTDYVALFGSYGTANAVLDLDCDGIVLGTDFLQLKFLLPYPVGGP